MPRLIGTSFNERREYVEKKDYKGMVYWEDASVFVLCGWCESRPALEEYLKYVILAHQFLASIRGEQYNEHRISHGICEDHKQKLLADYHARKENNEK